MKVISWLEDAEEILKESAVALGNFDGMHKGHQELIKKAVEIAREENLSPLVFTFANHPMNEIKGKSVVKSIMDIHEKAIVSERMGVDYMVNVRFDRHIMKLSPDDFVKDILVKQLHAGHAVCGFNYSFGYKGEGTPEMLTELGKKHGFKVSIVDEFKIEGVSVSSTLIRALIAGGDMQAYTKYTGRTYKIGGYVMHGRQFGRRMGFPTANLNLSATSALPMNGVYVTRTWVNNEIYRSVTNIGNKPTVGEFDKNAETHIFDYNGDLYGARVVVEFITMLRPEYKFENVDALVAQIKKDCVDARNYKC